ncbi:MAG: hypothetical protein GY711_04355 [bacterium]|nr:hypothetical protein [bacterium]
MTRLTSIFLLLALAACVATEQSVSPIGSAHVVSDFDSYTIDRVGLVPVAGTNLDLERSSDLQAALLAEFSMATRYEVVELKAGDLAEIPPMEAHRRGWYRGHTIRGIAKRFQLDALLIATLTDEQVFPPQRLGVQVDLVSCETGQTIWAASVHLDAASADTRKSLEIWAKGQLGDLNENGWELVLISPRRFARFAAYQLAQLVR